jgi:hypothetical protein
VRQWTDVAVGRCVSKSVSPEEAVGYELRCSIAQLMEFWRHDLPEKWAERVGDEVPSSMAYDAAARLKPVNMLGQVSDMPAEEFYAALESDDLTQTPQLSDKAWKIVCDVTGVSKEEWEQIPADVRAALEQKVTCPECGASGKLTDTAQLVSAPDPFSMSSGASLHFSCKQCQAKLNLDTAVRGLETVDKKWTETKSTVFWVVAAGLMVAMLFVMWLLTLK